MKHTKLTGKTIVITGASSGAGRAAAHLFAKQSTKLVLAARNTEMLETVAAACRQAGCDVLVVPTDVSDPDAVVSLAAAAWRWQGRIDVWVNNAGVLAAGDFDKTPMDVHRQVILTNLLGYMNGAHAVLPYFKQQQNGILINNISIGGFLPVPYGAGYSASKFGLRGFFEALKGELLTWPGIHVCDLFPAFLHTPGILHAANFTGKVLKAAPPTYDPYKVARAMVRVSLHPKSSTYIGAVSRLFKWSHAALPQTVTNMGGRVIHGYLDQADPAETTTGNVHHTVNFAMQVTGTHEEKHRNRLFSLAVGCLAAVSVGVLAIVLGRKQ